MPLALDPAETVPVSLLSDMEKPEGTRPAFDCRYVTCREVIRIAKLINDADALDDNEAVNAKLQEALEISVVGWRNMTDRKGKAINFDPTSLDDVLTVAEKYELAYKASMNARLAEQDKKKLNLRRISPSPVSVPIAPSAPAAV